jgi:hypothetical protein
MGRPDRFKIPNRVQAVSDENSRPDWNLQPTAKKLEKVISIPGELPLSSFIMERTRKIQKQLVVANNLQT